MPEVSNLEKSHFSVLLALEEYNNGVAERLSTMASSNETFQCIVGPKFSD
jgi:hypothetical protein